MTDTIPNLFLEPNVWTDLYAATGFVIGHPIIVQNIGVTDIYLYSGATAPAEINAYQIVTRYDEAINEIGDLGGWALSLSKGGGLNVRLP